jgi:hypothetical protein
MTQHQQAPGARDQRDLPPIGDPAFFNGTVWYRTPRVVQAIDEMATEGDVEDDELLDFSSEDAMGPLDFLSLKQGQLH